MKLNEDEFKDITEELKILLEENKYTELVIKPRGYLRCELGKIEENEEYDIIFDTHISLCNTINLFNEIHNKNMKQKRFDRYLDRHLRKIEKDLNKILNEFHYGLLSRRISFESDVNE